MSELCNVQMNRFKYPQETVKKAIKYLKTKKGPIPSFIQKFPGAYTHKNGNLFAGKLRIIPTEGRDKFLRDIVYGKKSEYPFGRDSLFSILKNEVMNVSKRDIEAFLNAQGPIVHRRSRPKIQKREHLRQIRKAGILSVDLAHITATDFENLFGAGGLDYMGPPGSKGYQQDRYFLNCVDLFTGYLVSDVVQGKKPEEIAPKLKALIEGFEQTANVKVTQVEVDQGGEFMGKVSRMFREATVAEKKKDEVDGPFAHVRLIQKLTNAAVEQTNAKMQRIFWNLVAQRRGPFKSTAKQAVKISNRTYNRRIGMNPEDAIKKIAAGQEVARRKPKAGPTERKKAFKVGTKVRALLKGRTKGDDVGYKAYKGTHFGAVTPITKVRFSGVYPKYKVGETWKWGDEVILARPADTKSHNMVVYRPISYPNAPPPAPAKKKAKAKAKRGAVRFWLHQDVYYRTRGKKVNAKILKLHKDHVDLIYFWKPTKQQFTQKLVPKKEITPQPVYEIGDKVRVWDKTVWRDGEVEQHEAKGQYLVFWRSDNKKWAKSTTGAFLRPRQ